MINTLLYFAACPAFKFDPHVEAANVAARSTKSRTEQPVVVSGALQDARRAGGQCNFQGR